MSAVAPRADVVGLLSQAQLYLTNHRQGLPATADLEAAETIVDRYYGEGASRRMTWRRWHAARQLLAEETVGVSARERQHEEDAAFARASRNLQRMK